MEHVIDFGSKKIAFQLQYKKRKTLGIKVHPDTSVHVSAPADTPFDKIVAIVRKKTMWILDQQSYFLAFDPVELNYLVKSGYSVLYLGRQYKLVIDKAEKDDVSYKGNLFHIAVRDKKNAKALFEKWLKERAKLKIMEIAEPLISKFEKKHNIQTEVWFQEMPTRWGSCSVKNRMTFNPKLIHVPKRCIEYVVTHELCHLLHKHHDKDFFTLLTSIMPDWEKRKQKLDSYL